MPLKCLARPQFPLLPSPVPPLAHFFISSRMSMPVRRWGCQSCAQIMPCSFESGLHNTSCRVTITSSYQRLWGTSWDTLQQRALASKAILLLAWHLVMACSCCQPSLARWLLHELVAHLQQASTDGRQQDHAMTKCLARRGNALFAIRSCAAKYPSWYIRFFEMRLCS